MKRFLKWLAISGVLLILVTIGPIGVVETSCRGEPLAQAEPVYIKDAKDRRAEARTLLTYPEWHIVYAYEGYAEALTTGAPASFPYVNAVKEFWTSLCSLTEKSGALGEAGFDSKATIYTIGASFTLEMAAKGLYEETIGRLFSWTGSSQHDALEREMAAQYAEFLQQTPWYKFSFSDWTSKLWSTPARSIRGWERRIALTIEWKAKQFYAGLIAKAVADIGPDKTTMLVAHSAPKMNGRNLTEVNGTLITEVDRYRVFTKTAQAFASAGGDFKEIAGNDDILLSVIIDEKATLPESATSIYKAKRTGFSDQRALIFVKVNDLADVLRTLTAQNLTVEHIYDY